jgi:uncharacterized LabA/DUF88 family protein
MKSVIYIDAANILLSANNLDIQLDVFRLFQYLKDVFRSDKIVYFTGNFKSKQKYFQDIKDFGVEIVFKEIYNEENKAKANCDVEIAHRITYDIDHRLVERVILLSGDGDFVHLADFAQVQKIAFKSIAFDPKSCSRVIKKRSFLKVSYLVDVLQKVRQSSSNNEKPPTST